MGGYFIVLRADITVIIIFMMLKIYGMDFLTICGCN